MRAAAARTSWKELPLSPARGCGAAVCLAAAIPSPCRSAARAPPAPLPPARSPRHICSSACAGTSNGLPSWILKSPHALNCLLKVFKGWKGRSGGSGGSWAATDAIGMCRKWTCGVQDRLEASCLVRLKDFENMLGAE